jgi:hypothetical protein
MKMLQSWSDFLYFVMEQLLLLLLLLMRSDVCVYLCCKARLSNRDKSLTVSNRKEEGGVKVNTV